MKSNQTLFSLLLGGILLSFAVVLFNFWAYPDIAPPQIFLPKDEAAYKPDAFYIDENGVVEVIFPLNINTATAQELILIPGIGESTAQKIVGFIAKKQSISSLDELTEISGIGQKTVEKLQGFLYCE